MHRHAFGGSLALELGDSYTRRGEVDTGKVAAPRYPEFLTFDPDGEQKYKPLSRSSWAAILSES